MTDISFAPKEIIPPQVCRLEILSAKKVDTFGPQICLRLKVIGGEYDGFTFTDYCNCDEVTGQINQGSKGWNVFEAGLGQGFHKRPGVTLESLVGKQIMGKVTQTRTGSRNKVEHGTIGPVPPEEGKETPKPNDGDDNDDDDDGDDNDDGMFDDLPF